MFKAYLIGVKNSEQIHIDSSILQTLTMCRQKDKYIYVCVHIYIAVFIKCIIYIAGYKFQQD